MDKVFKRKIYSKLVEWKEKSKGGSALLIKGARRVGKSTIVKEFAQKEYKSYILIDFSEPRPGVLELFDYIYDLDLFFSRLSIYYPTKLYSRESLIVFDEVQLFPRARQAIKQLVKDGRYDYIETGSLIGIRRNVEKILIPSEEKSIEMHPMDFEEFLWALDDYNTFSSIRELRREEKPIGQNLLKFLMNQYRTYLLVGGMPQAVLAYLESNNFQVVDEAKRLILDLYEADFYKTDPSGRISVLFDSIPSLLSKHMACFREKSILNGSKKAEELFDDLVCSMAVNVAYSVTNPDVGLANSKDVSDHRLYVADTGLFITLAYKNKSFTSNNLYLDILRDKLPSNLGYVFENAVSQALRANGYDLYYHRFGRPYSTHKFELDFIIENDEKLYPIEVKSGQSSAHPSLDAFIDLRRKQIGDSFLLCTKDIERGDSVLRLPLFFASVL